MKEPCTQWLIREYCLERGAKRNESQRGIVILASSRRDGRVQKGGQ